MASALDLAWGRVLRAGVIAGLAGAFCMHAFVYVATLLPQHASILSLWQWVASAAVGKVAYTSPSYAWLGLALHLLTSIAWATGYVYIAQRNAAVQRAALIAGLAYGAIVYLLMQFVLYTAQMLQSADALSIYLALLAHTVFYGVPVALVAARVK
jgi:uncharacterized membrane protein YagU involved in acid resistance